VTMPMPLYVYVKLYNNCRDDFALDSGRESKPLPVYKDFEYYPQSIFKVSFIFIFFQKTSLSFTLVTDQSTYISTTIDGTVSTFRQTLPLSATASARPASREQPQAPSPDPPIAFIINNPHPTSQPTKSSPVAVSF